MNEKGRRKVGITESKEFRCIEDLEQTGNFSIVRPINLDYYGSEACTPGYAFGPYVRVCYVMHMVRSGCGELRKNGKVYPVKSGQAFLIYPKEETVYQASEDDPWNYMWIGFHGIQAEHLMNRIGFSEENPVITIQNLEKVEKTMEAMLQAKELTYVNDLKRMSSLYELLADLIGDRTDEKEAEQETTEKIYVRAAVNLIMNSYQRNVKVAELADKIGISRSYLSTIFKKEIQMSPQEFLICYRMERATSLLINTCSSISKIADEVGYTDALSFSKVFKKRYGYSPVEYRNQKIVLERHDTKGDYKGDCPL